MSIVHYFPLTARERWLGQWRAGLAQIPYQCRDDGHWPPPSPSSWLGTTDNPYCPLLAASSRVPDDAPSSPAFHLWNIDDAASISLLLTDVQGLYLAYELGIRRFRRLEELLGFAVKPVRPRGLIALPPGEAGQLGSTVWQQGWPNVALIANPSPDFIDRFGGEWPAAEGDLYTGILRREATMDFVELYHLIAQCDWLLGCSANRIGHLMSTRDLSDRFDSDNIEQVQGPPRPPEASAPTQEILDAIAPDAEEINWSGIEDCDLRALLDYPNLRRLNVSRRWWLDTQTISWLSQLTALNMRLCWVEDLDFLSPLRQLRQLVLNVEPLRGWQTLTEVTDSLHSLDLEDANIADLTPISRFASLSSLNIADTAVRDLTPLRNLKTLRHLDVAGCAIDDWTVVNELDGLQELIAAGCNIPEEARARLNPSIKLRV